MREVTVASFCDACWSAGQRTPAERAWTLAIVLGADMTLPSGKVIELCEGHAQALADLETLYAAAPAALTNGQTNGRARPVLERREPSDQPRECPICDHTLNTRNSLVSHIWTRHRGVPRQSSQPGPCPECGEHFGSPAGMGAHRKQVHGFNPVVEALIGLPGWSRLRAERWERGIDE